jgi:lysyl-tRNA synthetase class 2
VATARAFSPSDVPYAREGVITLAGRVADVSVGGLRISDAFSAIDIADPGGIAVAARVSGTAAVDVGDLLVLSVRVGQGHCELVELQEHHRPARAARLESTRLAGGVGKNLLLRANVIASLRAYFARERFLEVDTPMLVTSPGLDLHLDAVSADRGYLITSPEYQMKRLLAGGLSRIYQLSHVFRQGETGTRHNPEFTMLEWYRAFAGVDDVMRDTESLVADVAAAHGPPGGFAGEHGPVATTVPFARISVLEAFRRFAGVAQDVVLRMAEHDPDAYFRLFVEKVEPGLAHEPSCVFLVDFPLSQASLARPKPSDPRVCERFELYAGGVELCNGFGELTDPVEQRRRLLADQAARRGAGKPVYPIDERFLAALEEGMPPSAGNALGVDRLVALCAGEREIGRVMPFPASEL